MKSSLYKTKIKQPLTPKKDIPEKEPPSPESLRSRYPRRVGFIWLICHIIFAVVITLWYLHPYIFNPSGFGYIIYILEFPGAIMVVLVGQAQDIESAGPYIAAFFINSIFYGFVGYFVGYIFQTYGWDKEAHRLWKLESEVYEETTQPKI